MSFTIADAALPSEDEEEDQDYQASSDGSGDEYESNVGGKSEDLSVKQRKKFNPSEYYALMHAEDNSRLKHAPLVDEFMLQFQRRHPKRGKANTTPEELEHHLKISVAGINKLAREPMTNFRDRRDPKSSEETLMLVRKAMKEAENYGSLIVDKAVRFAGETVVVRQKLEKNSAAHRLHERVEATKAKNRTGGSFAALDDYVEELEGHASISTTEKSEADWAAAKSANKVVVDAEDTGYLGRQAFLEKSCVIEREKEVKSRIIGSL